MHKKMKKYLSFIIIVCYGSFCIAQETSSIDFVIRNVGINVDGHFNSFSVTTNFDASNNLKKISGEVKVKSIVTGIENRDEHLLEEDYFNASKHPLITLQSIKLEEIAPNKYTAIVDLSIKDKTKRITIPLTIDLSESSRKITSEFEINRRDFGVGGRSFVMSNTVKIMVVHIEKVNEKQ